MYFSVHVYTSMCMYELRPSHPSGHKQRDVEHPPKSYVLARDSQLAMGEKMESKVNLEDEFQPWTPGRPPFNLENAVRYTIS